MISKQDIEKLAALARIDVSEAETERLQQDLERILSYVAQLDRAETGAIEPLAHVVGLENAMRGDETQPLIETKPAGLVEAAPTLHNNFISVPPVWKR